MIILSIETSCDETAISLVHTEGQFPDATYKILGNALHSQTDIHATYGGVYPTMAKREHILRIMPLTIEALTEANILTKSEEEIPQEIQEKLYEILYREEGSADSLIGFAEHHERPKIDIIAVTSGPGLEPALWVGVNFAKALSTLWNIPVVPINHMEGHILASLMREVESAKLKVKSYEIVQVQFPALALLISGGHTELILMKNWSASPSQGVGEYEKIGQTRDDAVGEAFDKVARMLGLPYPGGPKIGKLASEARSQNLPPFADLPRPMLNSGDLDFSFSGLKTAVLYAVDKKELTDTDKQALSRDFEDVVAEVLIKKTSNAISQYDVKTLIVGGGVSASKFLRQKFNKHFLENFPDVDVYFPNPELSTDNSIMIALAGHAKMQSALSPSGAESIRANGNLSLDEK